MTEAEFVATWAPSFGAGWTRCLRMLAWYLARHAADAMPTVQLKEKWGRLRIQFLGPASDDLHAYADAIEFLSGLSCEECGAEGHVNTDRPWYKTLCPAHWALPAITAYPLP